MRHATADPGDGRDHARELTDRGKDEAHRVGSWLAANARVPDRVLCSSALRCRETFQALCAGLGSNVAAEFDDRLYNASAEVLLDSLTDLTATATASPEPEGEIVLLIAHNPGISYLALELADESADSDRLRSGFAPATIACFETHSSWSLLSRGAAHLTYLKSAFEL